MYIYLSITITKANTNNCTTKIFYLNFKQSINFLNWTRSFQLKTFINTKLKYIVKF